MSGKSNLSFDDDKLRLRSSTLQDTGMTLVYTRGGRPRPALHVATSPFTGLVFDAVGGRPNLTPQKAVRNVLDKLAPDGLRGSLVAIDRYVTFLTLAFLCCLSGSSSNRTSTAVTRLSKCNNISYEVMENC